MTRRRVSWRLVGVICLSCAAFNEAYSQQPLQFGPPVKAEAGDRDELVLSDQEPPRELANGAEIILVSGYEASDKAAYGTRVKVKLDRAGKQVLLVLTSYENIAWEVEASPGTIVKAILVSAYYRSTLKTRIQTAAFAVKLPYAYELENKNFSALLAQLNKWFGTEKVDAFRGKYSLPATVEISQLDPPKPALTLAGPVVAPPVRNFAFKLYRQDYSPVEWTLTGPKDGANEGYIPEGKVAVSPSGDKVFLLRGDNNLAILDRKTGQATEAALPGNFPRFSWAMDVAYDSRRNIVSVISLGGEGFFYRLDARTGRWIDFRSVNGIDVFSLAYDRKLDRYVAWTDAGELLFISGEGNAQSSVRVTDRLPGFNRLYDSRAPRIGIAPDGNDIALLVFAGSSVKSIWHYDAESQTARLTYQRSEEKPRKPVR